MGLHIALIAAAARGHRKRHGNARPQRRIRPILRNHRSELVYRAAILQLVARCREIVESSLHELKVYWPRPAAGDGVRAADSVNTPTSQFIRKAKHKLGNLDIWSKRMVGMAVERNRENVDDRLSREIERAIGVDVSHILTANGHLLKSMTEATRENIALIKTIPEKYFGRVEETITSGWSQGLRWESMVEQIQKDGDVTEERAKLIARDQTSKMNAAINEERQKQVGIERYEWSTSQDERVRDSHADMEGKVCSWDDPPDVDGEKVHPGEAINCRCTAIPIVDMDEVADEANQAERMAA